MQIVDVHEAEMHLERLLGAVEDGQEIIIARDGKPIAKLAPYAKPRRRIAPPGSMEGQAWIADDFDAPIDSLFDVLSDQ